MSDGSTYLNRTNPQLHDYYRVTHYDFNENQFVINTITRPWKTDNLRLAKTLKSNIETGILARVNIDNGGNTAVRDFFFERGINVNPDADILVSDINKYVELLQSFINTENDIIIWKYENGPPHNDIPTLPYYIKKFYHIT
jgi:hypothetical protein